MNEVAKATPVGGIAGLKLFGVALPDWLVIATLIYTIMLIVEKSPVFWTRMRAMWRKIRGRQEGKRG